MSHLTFSIMAFSTNFCLIKCDLSGNTVWLQISPKWTIFWHFYLIFGHLICKRSSLRSQCWMRLFQWFSNTVLFLYETNLYYEALDVCFSKCKCFSMGYRPHDDECELTDALLFIASKPELSAGGRSSQQWKFFFFQWLHLRFLSIFLIKLGVTRFVSLLTST